jgi:hypothetical protein
MRNSIRNVIVPNTLFLIKRERKTVLIIVLSILFALSSLFVLFSILHSEIQEYNELAVEKRTYLVDFYPREESNFYDNFSLLFERSVFPRPEEYGLPLVFGEYEEGTTGNSSIAAGGGRYRELRAKWQFVFGKKESYELNYEVEVPELVEGRWFTEQEIEEGSNCVVLDKSRFPGASVGDNFTAFGVNVEVIGLVSGEDNFMPFSFIKQPQVDKGLISVDSNLITFEKEISKAGLGKLESVLRSMPTRLYDDNIQAYMINAVINIVIIGLSILIVSFNLFSCYHRLVDKNIPLYKVVYFCGGTKGLLYIGLLLPPLVIITPSYLIACSIFNVFISKVFSGINPLTFSQLLLPFVFFMGICTLYVINLISSYLRKERIL